MIEAILDAQDLPCLDLNVRALTLTAAGWLMDHDLRVRQRQTLALRAGREQKRAHRRSQADTDGGNIRLNVLHGVIDGETRSHTAAGAVDIKLDVLIGILRLQIQQLRHDQAGGGVIDLLGQHDDAVVEQAGKNVIRALPAGGLLDNVRY